MNLFDELVSRLNRAEKKKIQARGHISRTLENQKARRTKARKTEQNI